MTQEPENKPKRILQGDKQDTRGKRGDTLKDKAGRRKDRKAARVEPPREPIAADVAAANALYLSLAPTAAGREMELLALEMYAARLRRLFDSPEPKELFARRERVRIALTATAELAERLRVPEAVAASFEQLAAALAALNVGTTHPLLAAPAKDGPPRDPAEVWKLRAEVAVAIECLSTSPGKSRQWAISQVVTKYKGLKRLCRGKADLIKSAEGWVTRFRKEATALKEARETTVPVEAVEQYADGRAIFREFYAAGRIKPEGVTAHGKALLGAANAKAADLI